MRAPKRVLHRTSDGIAIRIPNLPMYQLFRGARVYCNFPPPTNRMGEIEMENASLAPCRLCRSQLHVGRFRGRLASSILLRLHVAHARLCRSQLHVGRFRGRLASSLFLPCSVVEPNRSPRHAPRDRHDERAGPVNSGMRRPLLLHRRLCCFHAH